MSVHIGKLLRELYLASGIKMARFAAAMNASNKTIYYHFGQADLHTSILETYEHGLKDLGFEVDIWEMIYRKRRGEEITPASLRKNSTLVVSEPSVAYHNDQVKAAELLRQAADLLSKPQGPAPDRDKAGQ
jgi:hypothetical protein